MNSCRRRSLANGHATSGWCDLARCGDRWVLLTRRCRGCCQAIIPGDLTPCAPVNGLVDCISHSQFWDNE